MIQTGDEMEFDSGDGEPIRGTVTRVLSEGKARDGLTGDELIVVDPDDPLVVLDTPDGEAVVYASEAKTVAVHAVVEWADLVPLLAAHEAENAGRPERIPGGGAVKTVFERGLESWPGEEKTTLGRGAWALGRTRAFLAVAAGGEIDGYVADRDLLPSD